MIIKARNNLIFKNKNPIEMKSNTPIENIRQYWNEFVKNNKNVYNGNVYCVTNIKIHESKTIFELAKTKFENIVYAKKHSSLKTRCLFVATYFITTDGYYCIIKKNQNIVDLIGGMADDADFEKGSFDAKKCLYREVKEELGLDINNKEEKINLKYLKVPSKKEDNLIYYPIGIIYETFLKMTSDELKKEFNKNKDIIDGEIKEIVLLKDFSRLKRYEKRSSYLLELFECIDKDSNLE